MHALGADLSGRTDGELRRHQVRSVVGAALFAVALAVGVVLWMFPLPRIEAGLITLILVLTGALNLPISLWSVWRARRQVAVRWYERELWVRHEGEAIAITPTPSVALARLRAQRPAA